MSEAKMTLALNTIRALNTDLPGLSVQLWKGNDYLYFTASVQQPGLDVYETHSVYVNSFNQLPFEQWVVEGHTFIRKVKGIVADWIEFGP